MCVHMCVCVCAGVSNQRELNKFQKKCRKYDGCTCISLTQVSSCFKYGLLQVFNHNEKKNVTRSRNTHITSNIEIDRCLNVWNKTSEILWCRTIGWHVAHKYFSCFFSFKWET